MEDTAALAILVRINLLQMWRRLKSVREQSRLLTSTISLFVLGYLGLSFWLFQKGLKFMASFPGLGTVLTERLLYLLFAFLFGLLLLSNLVISYTNLFRNREAAFLLTLPLPWQTIFRWKFIESVVLASWAFVFLIAPFLGAFGLNRAVHWHFYLVTVLLIGLFIILPGVAGCWLAIQLARYLDRRSFQVFALVAVAVAVVLGGFWWKAQPATDDLLETRVLDMLDQLLLKTRFAQFPFLPSYWLSTSVIQLAEGAFEAASFFMLVLLSHVSFFGFLVFTRFGQVFYDTASVVQTRAGQGGQWAWFRLWKERSPKAEQVPGFLDRFFGRLFWVRRDVRALLVKDARTFWRDTAQWGQTVMLFGLLGVYVINLRHFTYQLTSPFWTNLVAYLNLGACSLNLATLTTRFVFPQFSLEGRRLWIVGMAPMGLARVVKAKYWLASFSSLLITLSLISLSSYLLKMTWVRILFFSVVIGVMTLSLNGLAVGLGVLFPNLREANPSKIVSGFGGTLCLVLSFLYILASILALGFGTTISRNSHAHWSLVLGSVAGFCLLSLLIGWLPLKLGLRRLSGFES
jgi:ABC-2 type transport system permease protein